MASCNVLYESTGENKVRLRTRLRVALRTGNLDSFMDYLKKRYNLGKTEIRIAPRDSDPESDVITSTRALDQDIQDILREWDAMHPVSPVFDQALDKIRKSLNVVDDTQTEKVSTDLEVKTKDEVADKNTTNLQSHLAEFYGLESFDITTSLKQDFKDMMTSLAYYDVNSGSIRSQKNPELNKAIRQQKGKMFASIVHFLKARFSEDADIQKLSDEMYPNDVLDSENYFKVLSAFYVRVARQEGFQEQLQRDHAARVKDTAKVDKTSQYRDLVRILEQDADFTKYIQNSNRFTGHRMNNLRNQLYTADHYSEYYATVKNWIQTRRKDDRELNDRLSRIEEPEHDTLEAANAYTVLRHFDSILKDLFGDQISIAANTVGYETSLPNKYSYHTDTAHEIKGWQTSEDIGSEKHTSKFTNAVIGMIRVYDYKTGDFMNRRADNTSIIVATRNLINSILTGEATFSSGRGTDSASFDKAVAALRTHVLNLHDDPVTHLQSILELLFEKQPRVMNPLINSMHNRNAISDYDLNILYSLYDLVFSKANPMSFFKQSIDNIKNGNQAAQSILEEIAGFVDRNVTATYLETVYDNETGGTVVRAKKKFFNNKELYKRLVEINAHVNDMSMDARNGIQDKYQMRVEEGSPNTRYTVTVGGKDITLVIPNVLLGQILSKNLSNGPYMRFEVTENPVGESDNGKDQAGLFARLDKIDLVELRQKYTSDPNTNMFTADEQALLDILRFLDDTLNLGILTDPNIGLQTLHTYKSIYKPVDHMDNFLMPLLKLGIRAAYANEMYINAGDGALSRYLSDSRNAIYDFHLRNKKSKLFSNRFNHLKYQIASYSDDVLSVWTDAQSILRGETSKATTKDRQGNSIPNNSVSKLGGILHYYLGKQFDTNTESLFFASHRKSIKNTYHDLEVTNMQGDSKLIKAFSNAELFYHAIFNKFWGSYLKYGTVIVQPTEYSDKSTFLNWEIDANPDGRGDLVNATPAHIIHMYKDTIGAVYKKVYESTVNKLAAIVREFHHLDSTAALTTNELNGYMHQMTEDDLVKTAMKLGLTVELEKDYRILKDREGKSCVGINELLEYNANLYTNSDALAARLSEEKNLFLKQLLLDNCAYQVLDHGDILSMYTDSSISDEAHSRNPIMSIIRSYFKGTGDGRSAKDRQEFFSTWVDATTGRLILARQGNTNIISGSDVYDETQPIELNPFLDKFFYTEGFLSNNLRYSLTGFEINHPTRKNSPLAKALKIENLAQWNEAYPDSLITEREWSLLRNGEQTGILDQVLDATDLKGQVDRLEATAKTPGDKVVLKALRDILKSTHIYNTNTSQSTQFKRNVIIPATLQHCMQNTKDGIPPQVKCAVIRDMQAPVFNYRGDHEKDTDSCDGSAYITPFQSILENKALGSQAVGFTKKPIWHSYDTESGTAFLAKFATDTMTNEAMRTSMLSTASLYKLFKKATNLQWDTDEGIDLTKSLIAERSFGESQEGSMMDNMHSVWFNKVILAGNHLYYQDKYGRRIEIVGFNKTTSKDVGTLYYTLEKSKAQSTPVKKYHVFYDETTPDGKTETSKHVTFDTYQAAVSFIREANTATAENPSGKHAHTINSLFELHAALGGVYCVDSEGNGSEYNNEVVVNFMNNVGWLRDGYSKGDFINQHTYEQPLKKYQIGYLLNNTAVKNGAKNINPESAWTDDSELTYFDVDSDGLGMQMNADHDIINSELTEFSQVIAATAAYGYTFDNTHEIFHGLAKTAFQASEKTLKAVSHFLESMADGKGEMAESELYDAIGRIVLMNQSIKNRENLTNVIMQGVQRVFDKYKDHAKDDVKIPFSDPNVYSEFIATLASTITRQSIKRKHPGSGCVMVPSYNTIQYFEITDEEGHTEKLMAASVLSRARAEYKNELLEFLRGQPNYDNAKNALVSENGELAYVNGGIDNLERMALDIDKTGSFSKYYTASQDSSDVNVFMMRTFLASHQGKVPTFTDASYFMPTDIVEVVDSDGKVIDTVDLDSLEKYYGFKDKVDSALRRGAPVIEDNGAVDYLMGNNQELATVGTVAEYRAYLDSLYPNNDVQSLDWQRTDETGTVLNDAVPLGQVAATDSLGIIHIHGSAEDIENFKAWKAANYPAGCTFRSCTTRPHNLRPSLIRWQYETINADGTVTTRYMNIFDNPVIKLAYRNRSILGDNYRKQVQEVLHNLSEGRFCMLKDEALGLVPENMVWYDIKPGTLQNEEAELVMSNIYKDVFDIGNESLSEVLARGEKYFIDKTRNVKPPVTRIYDMAFLRDNGKHTLITIGNVDTGANVVEEPFRNIMTNGKDEIVVVKDGRELFEVGRWKLDEGNVSYNKKTGKFESADGNNLDQSQYRIKDGQVQKRYDYVRRYLVTTKKRTASGEEVLQTNTLYQVANVSTFREAMTNATDSQAIRQQSRIIRKIYNVGDYKLAQINMYKTLSEGKRNAVQNALTLMLGDQYLDPDIKDLLRKQLAIVDNDMETRRQAFLDAKTEFNRKKAHEKWVSFQDSLKFISSRIPAQTLQSFMAMQLVGWTENSKNMAYVSHFQTYLQGSDYDIDKAYLMGQSYDSNSIYIKWSPYFDYSSLRTLEASKTLPVPKNVQVSQVDDGVDLTAEIDAIVANSGVDEGDGGALSTAGKTEEEKVEFLTKLGTALKKLEKNGGKYSYRGTITDEDILSSVLATFTQHERYNVPSGIADGAYKNVASANIYAVSHDIRNRDQAYTAVDMADYRTAADNSPKGEQAVHLNMLNPLTKYIMQYQSIVGKNVVGIAANGEKFWFNAYYYWTQALAMGNEEDLNYLKFRTTLERIKGRAAGTVYRNGKYEVHAMPNDTFLLPDLDMGNAKIRESLRKLYPGLNLDGMPYKYVDLKISELLSAATDNVKEGMILAKINASTNFAKMFIYLTCTGYDVNDIVAFMTSPVSEFISNRASTNSFAEGNDYGTAQSAIDAAQGNVNSLNFLHGSYTGEDPETGSINSRRKTQVVKDELVDIIRSNKDLANEVVERLGLASADELDGQNLNTLMRGMILTAVAHPRLPGAKKDLNLMELFKTSDDIEVNNYVGFCQDLILQLRGVKSKYKNGLVDMMEDVMEFQKVFNLASEISSIASGYLSLNQGLPTDKLNLLKKINQMRRVIIDRENVLGIRGKDLFGTGNEGDVIAQATAWRTVIAAIQENNDTLDEDTIRKALTDAYNAGIMNNYDPMMACIDEDYKKVAKDYLHVIKGMVNVLDMMDKIPHYRETLDCMKALVVADRSLSAKSRLIDKLTVQGKALSDQQLRGIIRYVDNLNILDFLDTCDVVTTHRSVKGFNALFDEVPVGHFDLSTTEGVAGFKHFMETEFLEYLRENHGTNPLVKHLRKGVSNGRTVLMTDVDLLDPNADTNSKLAYDEILRGTAKFELSRYNNGNYTITDMFQLYNLVVNGNQYGSERLTTMFKACSDRNSVFGKYFNFISARDYDTAFMPEVSQLDFEINTAPLVSPSAERFHREPFIKVKDPVWDYVIKRYYPSSGSYMEYVILPAFTDEAADQDTRNRRRANFVENCPFEMPIRTKTLAIAKAVNYDGELTDESRATLRAALLNLSMSGKILLFKEC